MTSKVLAFPVQEKQKIPSYRNFLEVKVITDLTALYSRIQAYI